jgi:hypothetical protein
LQFKAPRTNWKLAALSIELEAAKRVKAKADQAAARAADTVSLIESMMVAARTPIPLFRPERRRNDFLDAFSYSAALGLGLPFRNGI